MSWRTARSVSVVVLAVSAACSSSDPQSPVINRSTTGTGTPCETDIDCGAGICTWVGDRSVCTMKCSSSSDCISGWNCASPLGQQVSICTCTASQEICDLRDNDCNGLIDDGPYPNQWCAETTGPGYVCKDGRCDCSLVCGDTCTDLKSDAKNCGACGKACPATAECHAGTCECPPGKLECAGECVDPTVDEHNCGACGKECPLAATCASSQCVCPLGQTACGSVCADLSSDPLHCGDCAQACSGPLNTCENTHCVGALVVNGYSFNPWGPLVYSSGYVYTLANGVARVGTAGGGLDQLLVVTEETPLGNYMMSSGYAGGLAVDANYAYWTGFWGALWKIPIAGGDPILMVYTAVTGWGSMAIDETNAYWEIVGSSTDVEGAITTGSIYSVPLTTSTPTAPTLVATVAGLELGNSIVAVGGNLYFTVYTTSPADTYQSQLMTVPTTGGTPTPFVPGTFGPTFATDGTNLYAARFEGNDYLLDIVQIPVPSGSPVTTLAETGTADIQSVAVSSSHVYWSSDNFPGAPWSIDAFVAKVPLAGGPWSYVASGLVSYADISVVTDGTYAYWDVGYTSGINTVTTLSVGE